MSRISPRLRAGLAALIVSLSLSGCIYSNVKFPLDEDVNQTRLGSKVGRASVHCIAWLVGWGDAGADAAARDGGLDVINHLDVERHMLFFGLYVRITTIAYGD